MWCRYARGGPTASHMSTSFRSPMKMSRSGLSFDVRGDVRLRLRWVHDLLVNASVGGQLDDVAVRIAEIDRAAEAVVDRAVHLNRAGAALLQHAFEDIVIDAERDVEVERVLALEVERLARHLEEGEAGAIVHLEEGVQRAP